MQVTISITRAAIGPVLLPAESYAVTRTVYRPHEVLKFDVSAAIDGKREVALQIPFCDEPEINEA